MSKNVALFFDGTWNRPHERSDKGANTNVRKLFLAADDSPRQVARYIAGVGTSGSKSRDALGGLGGLGVSENIRDGYAELVEHYVPGDHLYLFGFSRGAYTARSLAGFVRCVGLLLNAHIDRVPEAFELYKSSARAEDSDLWPFLRQILRRENLEAAPVSVYLIGVWDTVGRLGIPGPLGVIPNPAVRFHRTDLPDNVTHARHALALHELRPQFEPVMWTSYLPPQTLKQVWFAGAHADVGGGYDDARLSDLALAWMAEEAARLGLILDSSKLPLVSDPLGPVHHELKWLFAITPSRVRSGLVEQPALAAETFAVHESARRRCWHPARAPYSAWRPDVKWRFTRVDELTLQRDLWLLYERPAPAPRESAWWRTITCGDIAEIVERTEALVTAGPLKDGAAGTLALRPAEPLARSLCLLFLFAGKQPLRALVDAYDRRFLQAYPELVSLKDESELHARARAWEALTVGFDAALKEARALLPAALRDTYSGAAWLPEDLGTVKGRAFLRFKIFELLLPPIRFDPSAAAKRRARRALDADRAKDDGQQAN
jgi:Uncharacterized alpha/beta hydrolase domain (DUF2235)